LASPCMTDFGACCTSLFPRCVCLCRSVCPLTLPPSACLHVVLLATREAVVSVLSVYLSAGPNACLSTCLPPALKALLAGGAVCRAVVPGAARLGAAGNCF
jgi:hypothetical protein